MKSTIPFLSVAAAVAVIAFLAVPVCEAGGAAIGASAPDFSLPSATESGTVALKELVAKNKAVAVIFMATKCPWSNKYNERMAALAKDYAGKGVAVVGINSNVSEPATEVAEHAGKHKLGFTVAKDPGNKVADEYGAQRTPEAFVIDAKGNVVYHGRIDENADDPKGVKSPDLRNALDAVLGGKPVPAAETKAFGCTIKRA